MATTTRRYNHHGGAPLRDSAREALLAVTATNAGANTMKPNSNMAKRHMDMRRGGLDVPFGRSAVLCDDFFRLPVSPRRWEYVERCLMEFRHVRVGHDGK